MSPASRFWAFCVLSVLATTTTSVDPLRFKKSQTAAQLLSETFKQIADLSESEYPACASEALKSAARVINYRTVRLSCDWNEILTKSSASAKLRRLPDFMTVYESSIPKLEEERRILVEFPQNEYMKIKEQLKIILLDWSNSKKGYAAKVRVLGAFLGLLDTYQKLISPVFDSLPELHFELSETTVLDAYINKLIQESDNLKSLVETILTGTRYEGKVEFMYFLDFRRFLIDMGF
jgi:hypothetical protein